MALNCSASDSSGGTPGPDGEGTVLVSVRQVCYRHGPLVILENVSFSLSAGRTLAIVGPQGAGKTTLLHILLGRLRPQSGQVEILGRPPAQLGDRKAQIGCFPQPPLADFRPGAVGRDALLDGIMPFEALKRDRAGAEAAARLALESVGRPDLAERRLDDLTPAEMCLLRLARALINRPRLLALDHPDAALAPEEGAAFYGVVQRVVADRGLALLALRPTFDLVRPLANEALWLNRQPLYYGDPVGMPEDHIAAADTPSSRLPEDR